MLLSKKDYIAKYGEAAWEVERVKRSAYQAQYYQKNKERKLKNQGEYRGTNKFREWRREYDAKRRRTKKGRAHQLISTYVYADREKGYGDCTITEDWIISNIFNSSCIYCGDSDWKHLGADRIDNSKPHTPENCVCSCGICNCERGDRCTVEEFIEYRKTHPIGKESAIFGNVVENGVIRKIGLSA